MGEKATIRLTRIDDEFRAPNLAAAFGEKDMKNTILWIRPPVSQDEADERNQAVADQIDAAQKLAAAGEKRATTTVANLTRRPKAVPEEGVAFTVRRCALRAMYATNYPLMKPKEQGQPAMDSEEDRAAMHYIGAAFTKAKPGGGVLLTKSHVALLRRKAHELGNAGLTPPAYGAFIEALDRATGESEHQAHVVEVLEPEAAAGDLAADAAQ